MVSSKKSQKKEQARQLRRKVGCGRGLFGDVGAEHQASASRAVFPAGPTGCATGMLRPNRIHLNAAINVFAKARRMKLLVDRHGIIMRVIDML